MIYVTELLTLLSLLHFPPKESISGWKGEKRSNLDSLSTYANPADDFLMPSRDQALLRELPHLSLSTIL